ncbi:cytochrome c oxidase subunit 3 [Patulibacter brassicae]|uniref:Cytochrome aa3 subunit 3 n=1 Tax=Patulibacter brassicae TaxID=1705717 RepID=A0ABU4VQC6_9ACTN|nr:cytochrome c oxidase subunit 3 [Patulibacter brassicae]MDX8152975.1 cytochrome c oxidase subunit 3 [Patulibacter brassicae]
MATDRTTTRRIPGEAGTWVFILGDLVLFAAMFATFLVYRAEDLPTYIAGHEAMSQASGALMTLALLASSLAAALATTRLRAGAVRPARRLLLAAAGLGALFCVLKGFEYQAKVAAGHGPSASDFWTFYFGLTGLHLAHVILGIAALCAVAHELRDRERPSPRQLAGVESVTTFWHMVDAVWIVLLALLYLAR